MDQLAGRRIAIVSRIYAPEPGAASLRLSAMARLLSESGAHVDVHTSRAPAGYSPADAQPGIRVRRFPVLRDRNGYVRGYIQYLSFDIIAFFALLFLRRIDAVIVEPPPTTGFLLRIACQLRRVPYLFYAADIWSEAAQVAGAPTLVVSFVRWMERVTYNGAEAVLAVSDSVARRVSGVAPHADVEVVGNGYDSDTFRPDPDALLGAPPYLLYAGTASEVHGAGIFIEAMQRVLAVIPSARLVFVGQGADRAAIEARAAAVAQDAIEFHPRLSPEATADWIRGANATLASVHPDGYEAFPTKMYASVGCGTPVIYTGGGEGADFVLNQHVGWSIPYDVAAVSDAMIQALLAPRSVEERQELAEWATRNHSLRRVSGRVANVLGTVIRRRGIPSSTTKRRKS
ncbi:glycosyltransferase family 4 protein [Microbacterium sp. NPDC055521]